MTLSASMDNQLLILRCRAQHSAVLAISAHHARLGEAHVVGASCAAGRGPSRAIGWRVSAVRLTVCLICRYARKRYGGMRRAQLGKAHKTATEAEERTRHSEDDSRRQGARERYSIATGVLLLSSTGMLLPPMYSVHCYFPEPPLWYYWYYY